MRERGAPHPFAAVARAQGVPGGCGAVPSPGTHRWVLTHVHLLVGWVSLGTCCFHTHRGGVFLTKNSGYATKPWVRPGESSPCALVIIVCKCN